MERQNAKGRLVSPASIARQRLKFAQQPLAQRLEVIVALLVEQHVNPADKALVFRLIFIHPVVSDCVLQVQCFSQKGLVTEVVWQHAKVFASGDMSTMKYLATVWNKALAGGEKPIAPPRNGPTSDFIIWMK